MEPEGGKKLSGNQKAAGAFLGAVLPAGRKAASAFLGGFCRKVQKAAGAFLRAVMVFCPAFKRLSNVPLAVEPLIFTNEELKKRVELEDDFILEIINNGKPLYERK